MIDFNQLKLRERIWLGYAVPLVLTIATTGVVVVNARQVIEHNRKTSLGAKIVQETDRLETDLYKRQTHLRGYLLTRNNVFSQAYEASVREYQARINTLEPIISASGDEQVERLQQLKVLGEQISEINRNLIGLVEVGKINEANQELVQGRILPLIDEAGRVLQGLNTQEDKLQAQRVKAAESAMRSLIVTAVLGAIAATVLAIATGGLISSRITRTINEIVATVASSSTEIAIAVEQQEKTVSQQAVSVNQTTVAMDELSVASQQSAEQAESAAAEARQVLNLIAGLGQVEQQHGNSLREKVGQIAERILYLSEQTNQIGTISTLVSDLANQTNMLALNAAVEASRAGNQGKGFAVIATEIRKLADQSRKSADRIGTLVSDIQNATNSTVMVTDEGTKTVESIVAAANNISLSNQQISLTSKQQAIAIQQVVDAMMAINQGASQTASGIGQTKVSTRQLSEAALTLKSVV
ncbi:MULTISPECIES: methyl-accepting chemotaxis protein [Trichocoleus]|uniref:Methyl-accepting chemotaxis protein n=1 Tax=Trichocoleus desertorum GB2-A4 TaxID=2933944 RepID=A0ABV0JEX8_9CYAN|nr:methyl-accepting chemotaxis protein [Trichocoleus sp. FACHB-46]MBD1865602.1 CHASE3 domain-containing protein [Trichocoleus sp. FACHB-46]